MNKNLLKYVRIQSRETAYLTGMPVGIFAAVHRLQEAGLLTDEEKAVYYEIDQVWFEKNLPNPPFYDDDKPGKPITWFKTEATGFMIEKLQPLMDILEKYSKPYDVVYSNFPGRIVYEDDWQVAVYSDNKEPDEQGRCEAPFSRQRKFRAPGRISPLSLEHLPMYADVIREIFATVANDYNLTMKNCPSHTSFITNERLEAKVTDGYHPFGYFVDGKITGFVSLIDKSGGIYEMSNLAVLQEYRHMGYGKAMLDFCKTKAAEFGGYKIVISIVEDSTILKDWYIANEFIFVESKIFEHMPFPVGYMEWVL
jgi:ribosomal protein S18 acetylase RimI-like enzyme